jgi:hypothetical protein
LPPLRIAMVVVLSKVWPQARRGLRTGCEKQARVGAGGTNDDAALHKYFSYRESCYGRNVPDDRRQRASAAASSKHAGGVSKSPHQRLR